MGFLTKQPLNQKFANRRTMFLILSVALFDAQSAKAANCVDISRVLQSTKRCQQNGNFYQSAMNCLELFQREIQKTKNKLSRSLIDPSKRKTDSSLTDAQSKNYKSNDTNHLLTENDLSALVMYGKISRLETEVFLKNLKIAITWHSGPLDFENESLMAYLSEDRCYGEPRQAIKKILAKMDSMIADLEKSKAAAAMIKEQSRHLASENGIQSIPGVDLINSGPQGTVTPFVPVNPGIRRSDVSGTEKLKK